MSLLAVIESYKQRLSAMNQAVSSSEGLFGKLENDIKNHLANHHSLLGAKNEVESILTVLTKLANVVAPGSPVTEGLNLANDGLHELDSLLNPEPASQNLESPAQ